MEPTQVYTGIPSEIKKALRRYLFKYGPIVSLYTMRSANKLLTGKSDDFIYTLEYYPLSGSIYLYDSNMRIKKEDK